MDNAAALIDVVSEQVHARSVRRADPCRDFPLEIDREGVRSTCGLSRAA